MSDGCGEVSLPKRIALWSVVGAVSALVGFTASASSTWSDANSRLKDHENRIAKMESFSESREKEYIELRESIVAIQVKLSMLTDTIKETSKDVKDIRTMVK